MHKRLQSRTETSPPRPEGSSPPAKLIRNKKAKPTDEDLAKFWLPSIQTEDNFRPIFELGDGDHGSYQDWNSTAGLNDSPRAMEIDSSEDDDSEEEDDEDDKEFDELQHEIDHARAHGLKFERDLDEWLGQDSDDTESSSESSTH